MAPPTQDQLGEFATAALPALWKLKARKGWSQEDLAAALGVSGAQANRILHGKRGAGGNVVALASKHGINPLLWTKPCPPNWRPHDYASLRPKAPPKARASSPFPVLGATGTDC